ncbi:MAG: RNA 2',3'-cyclic phosphodiesterase [Proteobacteria bacterium]|nr:MAG: RNA 2',3'-cyclic phosphodiesterase [Pseudomonadota bacterium]
MRLFVALEIPPNVRNHLADLINELSGVAPQLKWVRPHNLHVTLKFIGHAPAEKLDAMRTALSAIRTDGAIEMRFRGLGFFPSEKRPRVFWAGLEAPPNLARLAAHIDAALESLGFPREERAFSPHLTLARIDEGRMPVELRSSIRNKMKDEFGLVRTNQFHLMESKLHRSGAEYSTVASFSFFPHA